MQNLQNIYEQAKELGTSLHKGQLWNSGLPYAVHLQLVDEAVDEFLAIPLVPQSVLMWLKAAAWLHDTVEDTNLTLDDIEIRFGSEVRALVWAVTDEPGANRKERQEKTYPKIRNTPYAVGLKLADRIVNVTVSARNGFYDMYRKEYPKFRESLYSPGSIYEPMWIHLDGLMSDGPSKEIAKLTDKVMAEVNKHVTPLTTFSASQVSLMHRRVASILQEEISKLQEKAAANVIQNS